MTIHFDEDSYETVYDIDDAETFRRIDREGKLPATATPSPGKFIACRCTQVQGWSVLFSL